MKKNFKILLILFTLPLLISSLLSEPVKAQDNESHLSELLKSTTGDVNLEDYQGQFDALEFGPGTVMIEDNHLSLYLSDVFEVTFEGDLLLLQDNLYYLDPQTMQMEARIKLDGDTAMEADRVIEYLKNISLNRDQFTEEELELVEFVLNEVYDYDQEYFYAHFNVKDIFNHLINLDYENIHGDLKEIVDELSWIPSLYYTFWNNNNYSMMIVELLGNKINVYALSTWSLEEVGTFQR